MKVKNGISKKNLFSPFHSYIDDRFFSFKNFVFFLAENKFLCFSILLTISFIYGMKFFSICFGVDTELHIASTRYINWLQIGRFGLVFLQKIWTRILPDEELFNPCFATMAACFFLFFGTLLWCFILDIFSDGKIKKFLYIPFSVLLVSNQVWIEQIYFTLQSAECLFIYFLSPLTVYFLFRGALNFNFKKIFIGIFLTLFCVSVYQGVLMLIYCGIFSVFLLFYKNSACEKKVYVLLCVRLIILMILSAFLYLFINRIVQIILKIENSNYLFNMTQKRPYTLIMFASYIYRLFFAHITPVAHLVNPIVEKYAGLTGKNIECFKGVCLYSNFLLLPAFLIYVFYVIKNAKKSFLYVASALCVPFCVIFPVIIGGGKIPVRSEYAFPFASAFIFLYSLSCFQKKSIYKIFFFLIAFYCLKQSLISSMLNYSDVMRYKSDVRLSEEISSKIYETGATDKIPVFLYGAHSPNLSENYLKGEVSGWSSFEWNDKGSLLDSTPRGLSFMRTQGYDFKAPPDDKLIEKARQTAKIMPDFPQNGSVRNLGDVVVVRFSETTYVPNTAYAQYYGVETFVAK